jgi:DNA-directed RNA polymerase specialized sigma24 family protein
LVLPRLEGGRADRPGLGQQQAGGRRPRHSADQRAYLVRITTRQALVRLRTLGRRKESYAGPLAARALLTAPHVAGDVELADSISMAMLQVLDTLTPGGPRRCLT